MLSFYLFVTRKNNFFYGVNLFFNVFFRLRQEWMERIPGLEAFYKKYKESVQDMLAAMQVRLR